MLPKRYRALTATVFPGGFGSVQRVQDTYLERVVMFKSMKDATDRDQLLSEVRCLTRARSRHVVEIYDVICDEGGEVVGIIIEYLAGRSFHEFYKEANNNINIYIKILYQIGIALKDMHAAGVVHRDIKLDNMKESLSGLLKVFDFGISVASEDYRTKQNRGSFDYAAPELYVSGAAIMPELDIYAWGVCAWRLASAVLPKALLERPPQTTSIAPSIDSVLPGLLPKSIKKVIDLSISRNPGDRPTANEIVGVFEKYLVRGRHKGLFVKDDAVVFELSKDNPSVRVSYRGLGALTVRYDEVCFLIEKVEGDVFVNNVVAAVGDKLPDSCCIGFGAVALGSGRKWVTFSSSHPEVIL